ncbi:hypothetical protein, partial [Streptomyces sp. WAC00469]|uniref:hypothetical protein n=1 Tax=Streptomyces sp. WAC00469 TaxID=2487415 RepID=UPI0021AE8D00
MDGAVGQVDGAFEQGDGVVREGGDVDVADAPEPLGDVADLRQSRTRALGDVGHRVDEVARLARERDRPGGRAGLARTRGRTTRATGEHGGQHVEGDRSGGTGGVLAPLVPGDQRLAGLLHRGARV